jgi:hypothetical protein
MLYTELIYVLDNLPEYCEPSFAHQPDTPEENGGSIDPEGMY